jgi:hypothetical protein
MTCLEANVPDSGWFSAPVHRHLRDRRPADFRDTTFAEHVGSG